MDLKIEIPSTLNEQDVATLKEMGDRYFYNLVPPENPRPVCVFLRDENQKLIGGLLGTTRWNTLHIDYLWIDEQFRGSGYGKMLVEAAENKSKEMGCRFAAVGTFEALNARLFYEKLNYKIVSVSTDSPIGHTGYWFNKSY